MLTPLTFVPAGTPAARRVFPSEYTGELTVVSSDGRYWQGDHAWLLVLYALRNYRRWAYRLSKPGMIHLARGAFALLSSQRGNLARCLNLASDAGVAPTTRNVQPPACKLKSNDG